MSAELKELLGLPNVNGVNRDELLKKHGRVFRERMAEVNGKLQVVVAQGSQEERQSLEAQRDKLYAAFQKTAGRFDAANPEQTDREMDRLLSAVSVVEGNASDVATEVVAKRRTWLKREADFDDAMLKVAELHEAKHAKATALRKVCDGIRERAGQRKYDESTSALERMQGKLDVIYQEHKESQQQQTAPVTKVQVRFFVADEVAMKPIDGAIVDIGGEQLTTDAEGSATVMLAPSDGCTARVVADGYNVAAPTFRVPADNDAAVEVEVGLIPTSAQTGPQEGLTILVKDRFTGEALEGVQLSVGDQKDTTSSLGLATVELPVGKHSYAAAIDSHVAANGTIKVIAGDNPTLVIEMSPCATEGLTVVAKDAVSNRAVPGVSVTIGPQTDETDNNGLATLELPLGTYEYDAYAENMSWEAGKVTIVEGDNPELILELMADGPDPTDEANGAIHYRVVDVATGAPIENAKVRIPRQMRRGSSSGSFFRVAPGEQTYKASAPGYAPTIGNVTVVHGEEVDVEIKLTAVAQPMTPPASEETADEDEFDFEKDQAHVAVTVLDADGKPVDGVLIRITSKSGDIELGHTNEAGKARVGIVSKFEESKIVEAVLGKRAWGPVKIKAGVLKLGETHEAKLDAPTAAVVGQLQVNVVRADTQTGVRGCVVQLNPFKVGGAFSDENGVATLDSAPPGEYTVVVVDVHAEGMSDPTKAKAVVEAEKTATITIEIPGAAADGDQANAKQPPHGAVPAARGKTAGGKTVDNASAADNNGDAGLAVTIFDGVGNLVEGVTVRVSDESGNSFEQVSDDDGATYFEIPDDPGAKCYKVTATSERRQASWKALTVDGDELRKEDYLELNLSSNEIVPDARRPFDPKLDQAHVNVTVVDAAGKPVAGAFVRAKSHNGEMEYESTNAQGVAELGFVNDVDQQWQVLATKDREMWGPQTIPQGSLNLGQTQGLTLDSGEAIEVGGIEVRVVRKGTNEAVSECIVQLDPRAAPGVHTDDNGVVRYVNLPVGYYKVRAINIVAENNTFEYADVNVDANETAKVTIELASA